LEVDGVADDAAHEVTCLLALKSALKLEREGCCDMLQYRENDTCLIQTVCQFAPGIGGIEILTCSMRRRVYGKTKFWARPCVIV
jgi:hypothetical protein